MQNGVYSAGKFNLRLSEDAHASRKTRAPGFHRTIRDARRRFGADATGIRIQTFHRPEGKDVIWVPTPQALVDKMLDMAKVTPKDFVIDLGSGDGRTVITAAKRGA